MYGTLQWSNLEMTKAGIRTDRSLLNRKSCTSENSDRKIPSWSCQLFLHPVVALDLCQILLNAPVVGIAK